MADVFVSYKRDDLARVASIVQALRGEGLTVWWDRDIVPGAPWETTIEQELNLARAVIVAWSPAAVASENVKGEARLARDRGKLIQTFVARCMPPLFFGEKQGVELHDWSGDKNDARFQAIVAAVNAIGAGRLAREGVGYAPQVRRRWVPALVAAIALTLGMTFLALQVWRTSGPPARIVPKPSITAASPRRALLNSLKGNWDRQNGDCSAPIAIDTGVDSEVGDVIIVRTRDGFRSVGAIIAVENGAVISRDMSVNASGRREQWEYRPVGNDMTVIDGAGVATKLVRCRGAPQHG